MLAPLAGLNVLEYCDGIAGPYAGRLLAMLGATVVKVEPQGGDPTRHKPIDDTELAKQSLSPLYMHLNAGKRLATSGRVDPVWADVVITNQVRRQVAGTALDPARPRGRPLLVTVTAWGFEADEPGTIEDELLVLARSGVIGETGDGGAAPLRLPGWQSQYFAGACAAVAALTGLREPGRRHIDVSWLGALLPGSELLVADALATGKRRPPSGAFAPTSFPGGALPCADGQVCPGSFRAKDWELQCSFYGIDGLHGDERFRSRNARAKHVQQLWELIEPWYARHTKREIFQLCLDSAWTNGMVMTATDALTDPHLAAREFLGPIDTPTGSTRGPVRPFRMEGLPVSDQRVRASTDVDTEALSAPTVGAPTRPPLAGLRLLELTTAWAGPFVGNLLGQMGVEVTKIEANRPFEGYRAMRLFADGTPDHLRHLKADNRWWEISPMHNAVNRNKRNVVVDLNTADGRQVFLDLVARSDAVLCNFTTRVMPQLDLTFADLRAVNPDIVLVRMPAFGTTGPYAECAGYATVVEAMGGFAARFGYPGATAGAAANAGAAHGVGPASSTGAASGVGGAVDSPAEPAEEARVSATYWPDAVAGIHAALAVMTGIEQRDRTGEGCEIDLAHMEVMWCQLGEDLVLADGQGRDAQRMGNREPGVAVSGIFPTSNDRWVAVVGDDSVASLCASSASHAAYEFVALVVAAGGRAEIVNGLIDAVNDPRLAKYFETVDHPVTGPTRHARAPFALDGEPGWSRAPAALFDQHTDECLRELGYDPGRISQLRAAGVVGGTLPVPSGG